MAGEIGQPYGTTSHGHVDIDHIRDARYSDLPGIVRMGEAFHAAAGLSDIAEFNAPSFAFAATHLIESPDGVLLVTGDLKAMAGALTYPFYFNAAHRTAQEMFWWADPEVRGQRAIQLRRALEARARSLGAGSLSMLALDGMRPEALARLYRREGYRPMERSFIKGF